MVDMVDMVDVVGWVVWNWRFSLQHGRSLTLLLLSEDIPFVLLLSYLEQQNSMNRWSPFSRTTTCTFKLFRRTRHERFVWTMKLRASHCKVQWASDFAAPSPARSKSAASTWRSCTSAIGDQKSFPTWQSMLTCSNRSNLLQLLKCIPWSNSRSVSPNICSFSAQHPTHLLGLFNFENRSGQIQDNVYSSVL